MSQGLRTIYYTAAGRTAVTALHWEANNLPDAADSAKQRESAFQMRFTDPNLGDNAPLKVLNYQPRPGTAHKTIIMNSQATSSNIQANGFMLI